MDIFFRRISFLLLCVLLFAPLHAFLSTFLLYGLGFNDSVFAFLIKAWKEILIAALFVGSIFFVWWKKVQFTEAETKILWWICAFAVCAFVISFLPFNFESIARVVWGARFDLIFFVFLAALLFVSKFLRKSEWIFLRNLFFFIGFLSVVWGMFLHFVGHDFLVNFGYRMDWSTFYLDQAPAFCQKEAGTDFCRWQGFFVDPNRYAGFLLILIPAIFWGLKNSWWKYVFLVLALISLFFSFSASGYLAFVISALLFFLVRNQFFGRFKMFAFLAGGLFLTFLGIIYYLVFIREVSLDVSQSGHLFLPLKAIEVFLMNPWGIGLGQVGPASFKFGEAFISESWFLQVAVNTGVFGISVFLYIWWLVLKSFDLSESWHKAAFVAVCGVLLQNVFLHTLEDSGVYVFLMFLLVFAFNSKRFSF